METLVRMGEHIGQRTNEEQRQEYFLNIPKTNKKNATIAQLLCNLPIINNAK
jgi:phage terminase large subunit-like protein